LLGRRAAYFIDAGLLAMEGAGVGAHRSPHQHITWLYTDVRGMQHTIVVLVTCVVVVLKRVVF
jgi:hypothetical protein